MCNDKRVCNGISSCIIIIIDVMKRMIIIIDK